MNHWDMTWHTADEIGWINAPNRSTDELSRILTTARRRCFWDTIDGREVISYLEERIAERRLEALSRGMGHPAVISA